MDENILTELYRKRGISKQKLDAAIEAVRKLEEFLSAEGVLLSDADVERVRCYCNSLSADRDPPVDDFRAIARYFYLTGRSDIYLYFTPLFGGGGVLESIRDRAEELEGKDVAERVFSQVCIKPAGTPPEHLPPCAAKLMDNLINELPPERYRKILAGNHHGIPKESFEKEHGFLKAAGSLDIYLADRHERMISELQEHCDKGLIWYEQLITQEVVELVRSEPEMLSANRDGGILHITKIPYDPARWLNEKDPEMKKYHACHCPFVREALRSKGTKPAADWCYCSCGFEKWMFDNLLGADLEVELLESVLLGHDRCRFAVKLPEVL